jgi:hypothetical protein
MQDAFAAAPVAPPGMKLVDPLAHWAQRNSSGAFFKGDLSRRPVDARRR